MKIKTKSAVDAYISTPTAPARAILTIDRAPSETDSLLRKLDSPERLRLEYLTGLIHVHYENGRWDDVTRGWKNQRTGNVLTFEEMESRIAARIRELGLDKTLIEGWMQLGDHGLEESQKFYSLPFDERMACFRRKDNSR